MTECILAFDMGGSKLLTGLVSREGAVLWKKRVEWSPRNGTEVLTALAADGQEALAQTPDAHAMAIGAAIPGVTEPQSGVWVSAGFSGICDLPVAGELSRMFSLPAFADNDAKACALAERRFGAGRNVDDFLYLTVSNGIGGAVFSGGRLVRGACNGAGEIGHCTVVEDGRACHCGKKGCLEMYAAGPGIAKTYRELGGGERQGAELAALARTGDSTALRVWELEGEYLGRAIALAANLLNPARVILGGGLSLAFALYEQSLWHAVRRNLFSRPNRELQIMPTPLGYEGALLGAAAVALGRL